MVEPIRGQVSCFHNSGTYRVLNPKSVDERVQELVNGNRPNSDNRGCIVVDDFRCTPADD